MELGVLQEPAELIGRALYHTISILLILANEALLWILSWRWHGLPLRLVGDLSREGLPRERPLVIVTVCWLTDIPPVLLLIVLVARHPLLIFDHLANIVRLVSLRRAQWQLLDFVEGRRLLAPLIVCQPEFRISPGELVFEAGFVDVLGLETGLPNDTCHLRAFDLRSRTMIIECISLRFPD